MIRRFVRVATLFFILVGLFSCGGGGGGGSSPNNPGPATKSSLTVSTYTPNTTPTSARMVVQNGSGGTITYFTNSKSGSLTEIQYSDSAGNKLDAFFDQNQVVTKVVNLSTNEFVDITSFSSNRTDYNWYNASGVWQAGWAILKNPNGSFSTASILNSAKIKNINGKFKGSISGSYALQASNLTGLGPLTAIPGSASFYGNNVNTASVGNEGVNLFFISNAEAAQSAGLFRPLVNIVGGALIATYGGSYIAAAGGTLAALSGPVGWVGYAALATGGYIIFNNYGTLINNASNALVNSFNSDFSNGNDPIKTLTSNVTNFFKNGTLPNNQAPTYTASADDNPSSLPANSSDSQSVSSPAPEVSNESFSGSGADSNNNSYSMNGNYNPSQDTLGYQMGNNSTSLNGTLTNLSAGNASGNYTGTGPSGPIAGTLDGGSPDGEQPPGAPVPLTFTSILPTNVIATSIPYVANLTAIGSNFTNITSITFTWSDSAGNPSGSSVWTLDNGCTSTTSNDCSVNIVSDNYMTLNPVVVGTGANWSGTHNWTITLTDNTGATATQNFSVTLQNSTTTTLAATPTRLPVSGGSVVLTATVAESDSMTTNTSPTPSGTVSFIDQSGSILCQSVPLVDGEGTCSATLPSAPDTITVNYSGDSNYGTSKVTATVTAAGTINVTASPATLPSTGGNITIVASIPDTSPVATGTITFIDQNGNVLCNQVNVDAGSASCNVALTTVPNIITANYSGDSNYGATSGTVTVGNSVGYSNVVMSMDSVTCTQNSTTNGSGYDQYWIVASGNIAITPFTVDGVSTGVFPYVSLYATLSPADPVYGTYYPLSGFVNDGFTCFGSNSECDNGNLTGTTTITGTWSLDETQNSYNVFVTAPSKPVAMYATWTQIDPSTGVASTPVIQLGSLTCQ